MNSTTTKETSVKRFAIAVTALAIGYFFVDLIEPDYQCQDVSHIAVEGDSLWSIAERYCTGKITAAVDTMAAEYGTSIKVAQQVKLP